METKTKQEEADFTVLTDKHGFETKIVNFKSPKMCPRKGVIEIKAIRISNRHENRKSFSFTKDHQTGIHYGIPAGVDQLTGQVKFKRIILYNSLSLNLSNPTDAELWCVISRSEFLKGSPLAKGKPEYEVFDREKEAELIIIENKTKRKADLIIDDLSPLELYDMARNCGLSVENDSSAMVQSLLYKKAANNPKEFLEIWDNVNRPILTVFKRGIVTGLINFDPNRGYTWKNTMPLGANDSAVIKYLLSNISLLVTMDSETKERDKIFRENSTPDDYKKSVLDAIQNENHAHIPAYTTREADKEVIETKERLAKKEEELNAKIDKMNAMMEKLLGEKSVPASENVAADQSNLSEDTELNQLREEAHKLGRKGAMLMKDKEALRKYIQEQKEILS